MFHSTNIYTHTLTPQQPFHFRPHPPRVQPSREQSVRRPICIPTNDNLIRNFIIKLNTLSPGARIRRPPVFMLYALFCWRLIFFCSHSKHQQQEQQQQQQHNTHTQKKKACGSTVQIGVCVCLGVRVPARRNVCVCVDLFMPSVAEAAPMMPARAGDK